MKHKNKIFFILLLIVAIQASLSFLSVNVDAASSKKVEESRFIQKGTFSIIKYSDVIYFYKNQIIKIPIYGGDGGEVLYTDLLKSQKYNYSILSNIAIPIKNKNAKMTLLSMLDFYKKTLFKNIDINKPSGIDVEQDVWYIYYNFYYEKIPCNMLITIGANEDNLNELLKKKNRSNITIDNMEFYNNVEFFFININIGNYKEP